MLSGLSKQVQQEVQTYLWSNVKSNVHMRGYDADDYYIMVRAFLQKIGPHGRSGLTRLIAPPGLRQRFIFSNQQPFTEFVKLLGECKNLPEVDLCLPVATIFGGSKDREALIGFFHRNEPLYSSSLDRLTSTLQSLLRLRSVRINTVTKNDSRHVAALKRRRAGSRSNGFHEFAFTGSSEYLLLNQIRAQLQKLEGMKFELVIPRDPALDYQEWQSQRD
jgi:hypothetical protein